MTLLLEDEALLNPYEIYFSHQCDKRHFNRGAMKNIGFIAIKNKYPNDYKNITFIFNDVDTWPTEKGLIDYNTTHGIVKHFYGYKFALGGIFAIKGSDFEKSRGFANFWGWGIEDNVMNDRCVKTGLVIDRSQFYKIDDKKIFQNFNGYNRIISKRDSVVYKFETPDTLDDIKNIKYNINNEYINVFNFTCGMNHDDQIYTNYNIKTNYGKIRTPQKLFRRPWTLNYIYK
jgi:hypothetical protein